MNFDRHAQYDPIKPLSEAACNAKLADDAATTALDAQQAILNDLNRKLALLQSKVQPYGGATPSDYQNYGLTLGTLQTESAKLPALQDAQAKTKVASDLARKAMRDAVDATDTNPGAIEQV